jgi:hypothetical protein
MPELVRNKRMASRKDDDISRQDAAPTGVKKMWEWLPATINGNTLLFLGYFL